MLNYFHRRLCRLMKSLTALATPRIYRSVLRDCTEREDSQYALARVGPET